MVSEIVCCHTEVQLPPTMPPRPIGDLSNDDYVAQVLANEARDNSKKYALEGLGAYMPKKFVPSFVIKSVLGVLMNG